MKSKYRTRTALILCDRCIRALRSRGEQPYICDFDNNGHDACMWCETQDDELFKVVFEPYDDIDAEYDD